MKKKIAIVVNQNSGGGSVAKKRKEFIDFLQHNNLAELYIPQNFQETYQIVEHLAQKNYNAVIAAGGDGTLNVVSGKLLGTETALGIIPLGSGNGYARHHHISLDWHQSLKIIDNHKISLRDSGVINNIHFLNIAGIGYSATISHAFKNAHQRGLKGYTKTILKNLRLKNFGARVANANGTWEGETYMIDFCNGSQWGNNMKIEAGARDDDGSLSAVIFKKISPVKIPVIGFRIASNTVNKSPDIYKINGEKFIVQFEGNRPMHVDGEACGFVENTIEVAVLPKSLKIWLPV